MGGCFLACFGPKDGDRKRRNRRKNKILPRDQRHGSPKPIQPTLSLEEEEEILTVEAVKQVSEVQVQPEEQPSFSSTSSRKKVTFDTNVKTYEPVLPVYESIEALPTTTNGDGENQDESCGESSLLKDDSIVSSVGSYPPNHRYQNCRDSDDDDELEESEFEDSDLDDDDEDDDEICNEVWSEMIPAESMESTTEASSAFAEEVESHPMKNRFIDMEEEEERFDSRRVARNRSVYVHPVLNPVQNLTQWKALKSKPSKPQKENSSEFNQSSMNFRSKMCHSKHQSEEISVDASLSNWLGSSETCATQKSGFEAVSYEGSMSYGSNSAMSIEDRPILGALTVEELKQHSATNSPRRSPCRSPDDMPILGTVGRYWSHQDPAKASSGSSPSYKGMPNTRRGLYVK